MLTCYPCTQAAADVKDIIPVLLLVNIPSQTNSCF
jgi:hypothetical protein